VPRRVFSAFCGRRADRSQPKTIAKTTAELENQARFASGWHFGEAHLMPEQYETDKFAPNVMLINIQLQAFPVR